MKKLLIFPIILSSFSVSAAKLSNFEGVYSGKDGWLFKKDCTVTIKILPKNHPMKQRISSRNDVFSITTTKEGEKDHLSFFAWGAKNEASNYFSGRFEPQSWPLDLSFNDTEIFFENEKLTRVLSEHSGLRNSHIDCEELIKIK